jgi:endonuclease III
MLKLTLEVPSLRDFAVRVVPAQVTFLGKRQPLSELLTADRRAVRERRAGDARGTLVVFAAALLERNVTASSYFRRIEAFRAHLDDHQVPTGEQARQVLEISRYRYPKIGAKTLVAAMQRLLSPGFRWDAYFAEAEARWQEGFREDPLLQIPGIGPKTRNFALSEFSDYYCAPDLHVCRIMARTGLTLHGYGHPGISTADAEFVRQVINRLAAETGFPTAADATSPAMVDRMLWFYGQDRGRCDAKPDCDKCPATDMCLTGQRRS